MTCITCITCIESITYMTCITCIVCKTSLSQLERLGPIDRTPGIPGSDKKHTVCYPPMLGVQPLAMLSHLYLKIWDFISAGRVKWNLQSPLHALKHGLRIMVVIIVWLWPGLGSKGGLQDGMSLIVILIHGEGVLLLTHQRRLRASGCWIVAGAPFHHLKWVWWWTLNM